MAIAIADAQIKQINVIRDYLLERGIVLAGLEREPIDLVYALSELAELMVYEVGG